MGQQFGGGIVDDLVEVPVIPLVDDLAVDDLGEVVEIDDHPVSVQRAAHRDLETIGVTVQVPALARVPGQPVGGLEGERTGHAGSGPGHPYDANPPGAAARMRRGP